MKKIKRFKALDGAAPGNVELQRGGGFVKGAIGHDGGMNLSPRGHWFFSGASEASDIVCGQ
ncbi:hypothetical protein PInf_008059 [Phytophthora infestans]|nr:hypothetical protein PInf_008059 [Phytophthora infestans]